MRKISLLIGGAVIALAACSGDKKPVANDDLKKDLEMASTSDGLGVGTGATNQGTQVVSAIERTARQMPGTRAAAGHPPCRSLLRKPAGGGSCHDGLVAVRTTGGATGGSRLDLGRPRAGRRTTARFTTPPPTQGTCT